MAGRPKIFDEQEVINKAVDVFWTKGYESTSADELLAAMGIGKGSFYLAFKGGKKELYEKSLQQFSDTYAVAFNKALSQSKDPVQFVKDFFMALADEPPAKQAKGCYLGNALIEMSNKDKYTKKIAAKLLIRMEDTFTDIIRKAQATQSLKTKEKPEILARYLVNLWNGINVTRRMYPSGQHIKEVLKMNLQVLI